MHVYAGGGGGGNEYAVTPGCRMRAVMPECEVFVLDNYPPMKVRPMPTLSKLHSNRASLRSDLCDAGPLLRRSTSGVQCSFLIEHDHGSLVHGRKPLFVGRSKSVPALKRAGNASGTPFRPLFFLEMAILIRPLFDLQFSDE